MSLATYASKTKKDLSFDDLAGPVKKIPEHGQQLRTQNIKPVYTSRL